MAKARDIEGLDCSTKVSEGIKLVLLTRFDEMYTLRESALDFSDIEGVHDMRVASRRLRSAMRDFLPFVEKRALKKVREDLKRVADALGKVRDHDVGIVALEALKAETEGEETKLEIETFIKERNELRDKARVDLTETITADALTKLKENFNQALKESEKESSQNITFYEAGKAIINTRLEEFLKLSKGLYTPFKVKRLHNLRIAAKRLRYAMELFAICFGDEIKLFADEISGMQDSLGELHDCDMWIDELGKRLAKADKENERRADVELLSHFTKARTKHYRTALERWRRWQEVSLLSDITRS